MNTHEARAAASAVEPGPRATSLPIEDLLRRLTELGFGTAEEIERLAYQSIRNPASTRTPAHQAA
jgi:hypothetical protein